MSERQHIVFLDLETGGLDRERHPIIQIAAVAIDVDWRELEAWECKVLFREENAEPEALKLNSYDPEVWEDEGLHPRTACSQLSDFLRRYSTVPMVSRAGSPYTVAQLAGHNLAGFDLPFLQSWYGRLDQFMPASYRGLDTLQLAMWSWAADPTDTPANYKLETLADHFGIDHEAHDALADVRVCVEVAKRLLARGVSAHKGGPQVAP